MSDLENLLRASIKLATERKRLQSLVDALTTENRLLRAEVRAMGQGRDEFDMDGDQLPCLVRPQAG